MKVIEFLKLGKSVFEVCREFGIKPDDVRYIPLYEEYCDMIADGNKVSYAVAVLADRYHISQRKVYGLKKWLQGECTPNNHRGGVKMPIRI